MTAEMKIALRAFCRLYRDRMDKLFYSYDMDCGFDGGEFCSDSYHDEFENAFDKISELVAEKFNIPVVHFQIAAAERLQQQEAF